VQLNETSISTVKSEIPSVFLYVSLCVIDSSSTGLITAGIEI